MKFIIELTICVVLCTFIIFAGTAVIIESLKNYNECQKVTDSKEGHIESYLWIDDTINFEFQNGGMLSAKTIRGMRIDYMEEGNLIRVNMNKNMRVVSVENLDSAENRRE